MTKGENHMPKFTIDTTLSDELAKKNKYLTGYERPNQTGAQVFDSRPTKINTDGTVSQPGRFDR
jgi:hypothetical protein